VPDSLPNEREALLEEHGSTLKEREFTPAQIKRMTPATIKQIIDEGLHNEGLSIMNDGRLVKIKPKKEPKPTTPGEEVREQVQGLLKKVGGRKRITKLEGGTLKISDPKSGRKLLNELKGNGWTTHDTVHRDDASIHRLNDGTHSVEIATYRDRTEVHVIPNFVPPTAKPAPKKEAPTSGGGTSPAAAKVEKVPERWRSEYTGYLTAIELDHGDKWLPKTHLTESIWGSSGRGNKNAAARLEHMARLGLLERQQRGRKTLYRLAPGMREYVQQHPDYAKEKDSHRSLREVYEGPQSYASPKPPKTSRDVVRTLLTEFGVENPAQLDPEQRRDFMRAIEDDPQVKGIKGVLLRAWMHGIIDPAKPEDRTGPPGRGPNKPSGPGPDPDCESQDGSGNDEEDESDAFFGPGASGSPIMRVQPAPDGNPNLDEFRHWPNG